MTEISMGTSDYIQAGNEQLHYISYGSSDKLLLAFHGYSNNATLFAPFARYLPDYTVISIDLPHHGQCKWPEQSKLSVADLQSAVRDLMDRFSTEKFSLLGYSLGGRVCLKITELFPQQTEQVVLMAPDGLVFNKLYYFVTANILGKRLFSSFLKDPSRYMHIIDYAKGRGWISETRYKFAMQYLGTESSRHFLLRVWPCMSLIIPDMPKLRKNIQDFNIPVDIFMGRYDKVIPPEQAHSFKKGLDTVHLHILDKGHRLFDADSIPQITACFH